LRTWVETHYVALETGLVAVLAIEVALGFVAGSVQPAVEPFLLGRRGIMYATLVTLAGALLGFAITAYTLLVALDVGGRIPPRVRGSNQYPALRAVFHRAVTSLGAVTVAACIAFIFDREGAPAGWAFILVASLSLLALFRLSNLLWVLGGLLNAVSNSVSAPAPEHVP